MKPGDILENGYEVKTTFWDDFTIADKFGADSIKDTYDRAFNEWKDNVEYLVELILVLNWKIWEHYEKGNKTFAQIYDMFWRETDQYAVDNLKGDDLKYYYRTTD